MSRYVIQKDGIDYVYGFDHPCSEYFLCNKDDQLVGLGIGSLHSYGSAGNLMRGFESTGIADMIPDTHLQAIAFDLPF